MPDRLKCPECGAVGRAPEGTLSWWHPSGPERDRLAAQLGEAVRDPRVHVAECVDAKLNLFLMEPDPGAPGAADDGRR